MLISKKRHPWSLPSTGLVEAAQDFALRALLSRAKSFHAVLNLNFEQGSMTADMQ
jgi:hypothetical protein